jgi:hypothetical protein
MITTTRRPALSWAAVSGAVRYQVWINISRTDYDFTQSGNLLDSTPRWPSHRHQLHPTWDSADRWTYKWYVVSVNGSGATTIQHPYLQPLSAQCGAVADGINIINGARDLNRDGAIQPYEDWRNPVETRVNDLLSRMTTPEKAYQMFYNAQAFPQSGWHFGPAGGPDLNSYLLAAAGTRLGIPFVSAGDTIHGYQTSWPTQSALAAGKDYLLDYKLGDMTAPGAVGGRHAGRARDRWPRSARRCSTRASRRATARTPTSPPRRCGRWCPGYRADPELNPQSVLATVKHWPGEGAGGEAGIVYDAVTIKYHMIPFRAAMDGRRGQHHAGVRGSSYLDPGGPGAGDSAPILAYLRNNLGYTGLITTDWLPSGSWIGRPTPART